MHKKLVSLVLVFMMMVSLIPSNMVFAVTDNPTDVTIVAVPDKTTAVASSDPIEVTYQVTAKFNSPVPVGSIDIHFVLPEGMTFVSATLSGNPAFVGGNEDYNTDDNSYGFATAYGVTVSSDTFLLTLKTEVEAGKGGEFKLGFGKIKAGNFDGTLQYSIDAADVPALNVTVPATGVTVQDTLSMNIGDKSTLSPTVLPAEASNKDVEYKSNNTDVATVSATGEVTGVSKGSATITVTTKDGGYTDTCDVTVNCLHTSKTEYPAVASTCIAHGHNTYYICDDCGEVFKADGTTSTTVEDETLPFSDHDFSAKNTDPKYLKSVATCISPAIYYYSCSVCGEKGTETFTSGDVDPNNHVGDRELRNAKAATDTEEGYTGDYYCSACGVKLTTGTVIPVNHYAVNVTGGNASVGAGTIVSETTKDTVVTITADAPAAGMQFKEWDGADSLTFVDGTDKTSATAKFTMPAQTVTLTAVYEGAPLTGTAAISGDKEFGAILTVSLNDSNNTGDLTYQWKRGTDNIGTNSDSYTLVKEDIGKTISCEITSSIQSGKVSSDSTDAITKAAAPSAPTGLVATAPTEKGLSDGKITGTDSTMQYSATSDFTNATSCTGNSIDSLAAGKYYVRVAETETTFAGTAAEVTVVEGVEKFDVTVTDGTGSGRFAAGVDASITANAAPDGKHFAGWEVTSGGPVTFADQNAASTTFTTVSSDVTITATYEDHAPVDPTVWEYDADSHWQVCSCGAIINKEDHDYDENGVCKVCGYNSKLPPTMISTPENPSYTDGGDGLTFRSDAFFSNFIKVTVDGVDVAEDNYTRSEGSTIITLKPSYLSTLPAGKHTIGIVSKNGTATADFTVAEKSAPAPSKDANNGPTTGDHSGLLFFEILLAVSLLGVANFLFYKRKLKKAQ